MRSNWPGNARFPGLFVMKTINATDRYGKKNRYLIRDTDDPSRAQEIGVPIGPPDVELMPWDQIKIDLHNALVDAGILSWDDLVANQSVLPGISRSVLKKHIVALFKATRGGNS